MDVDSVLKCSLSFKRSEWLRFRESLRQLTFAESERDARTYEIRAALEELGDAPQPPLKAILANCNGMNAMRAAFVT